MTAGERRSSVPGVPPLRLVAVLAAAAVLAGGAPAAADVATVFTIAGSESPGAAVPLLCGRLDYCEDELPWPEAWSATERRIDGSCLDHFADGSILLCSDGRLVKLSPDGRMRIVPVHGDAGDEFTLNAEDLFVTTAAIAPGGGIVMGGPAGTASVAPDGLAHWLAPDGEDRSADGIDVLADGSVLAGDAIRRVVERVWPGGRVDVVAGGARAARIGQPVDVSAFPDGSFAIAENLPVKRVLRVDAAGVIAPLAGGGRGWREGAPATGVALGYITAVRALDDGRVLVGGDRGVFEIGRDGRIRTLVRGLGYPADAGFPDLRSVATDGRAAAGAVLAGVTDVDLLPDGRVAVLTQVPQRSSRLALIGDAAGLDRLAIALPGEDRVLLRQGRLDVVLTRAAALHVTVRGSTAADVSLSVPAGRTTLAVPTPSGTRVHAVRVDAIAGDGAVATARLSAIPARRLSTKALDALTRAVDLARGGAFSGQETRRCRRTSAVAFRCRWVFSEDGELERHGSSRYTLRADGLIDYVWRQDGRRRVHRSILEPTL